MAGAARSACRQVAGLGLLATLWVGCAKIEDPPGGPPDFTSPVLLGIVPDSGTVLDGFDDELEFQFDEVIQERSGGGLENLVIVSPRPEQTEVSWRRSRVTVQPKGGWHPGVVYQVTLLPGVTDLRNNRLDTTLTVIFSTGGDIPNTRLTGTVVDWEQGRVGAGALVEAILLPDSLVYVANADSVGDFVMAHVPPGDYLMLASIDQNNDRERGSREAFDSVSVALDSAASHVFWTFVHDTLGPRVTGLSMVDSVTVRIELSQPPNPSVSAEGAVEVFALPDSTPVAVRAVWTEDVYDSVSTIEQAIADSLARLAAQADSAAADTLAADPVAVDTTAADSTTADTATVGIVVPADSAVQEDSTAAEAARIAELLALRPKLSTVWHVRMETPLAQEGRYLFIVRATNLSNATGEAQMPLVIEAPPDST